MKKSSFGGRRSSTLGGRNTFGRQNSFDGNDIRLSRIENRGAEKKSMLLKPGFSAKKSVSSDNLSAHDPKQWSSTVKKSANKTKQALVRSTTSINMTGFNLVASTPCVTPGFNPNLPGINSSYKNRRLSTESRYSSHGVVNKNRKEVRPLSEKEFQQAATNQIQNYFLNAPNASHILNNNGSMKPMTTNMFTDMCEYLLHKLDRNQLLDKSKYVEELPKIMKKYYYKGKVDKSWLITVNASHSFPQVVGLLLWLVELCETQNNFNVMDALYPPIFDQDPADDGEYDQYVEFKMYFPFLLNSYQVESRGTGKQADQEFLQKQEEFLYENYKNTLGIDEAALSKLKAEIANFNEELASLSDTTEEHKLEEMKAMKIGLQKEIVCMQKYIKDLHICLGEAEEHISKKTDEHNFQEKEIENLQKELNVVKGCINGQQITQEDKKNIEEEIISLRQDIQYEENCLNEYSNIVYSEDLNVVNFRGKLDKLFVQYNTLCAENMVVLPELENAIADKNVLTIHVRESLKEVDKLLKCLKNQNAEKLKAAEQKEAFIQLEIESAKLEYNNMKRTAESLELERAADKKCLLEITDRQFEKKKEWENKLYELQAEIKNIHLDPTEVEVLIEKKNNTYKLISEIEKKKEYILLKTTNALQNHAKTLQGTKVFVENLFVQQQKSMESIKTNYYNL
ncbi:Kinetochore protein Ndc80 [Cinara cedri]|uniref:Kinetochore protein NDC80 n=1 Tax=Cinara cedri TaxID=506608 RepID=A0A5E4NDD4_9HEMI|nr:Kinetochore protein Ndc80 [Cinara cedri]